MLVLAVLALVAACSASTIDGHGSAVGATGGAASGKPSSTPSGGATQPAAPVQQPADFSDCSQLFNLGSLDFPAGREARIKLTCAVIKVPLDYSDPSGGTTSVAMVRVHDSADTSPTGQLLVNPGGPGGSGVNTAVGLAAQVSDKLLSHFDLIGFDPRGVGSSSPISCLSNSQKDALNAAVFDLTTASGVARAKRAAKTYATACNAKYGSALADFDTVNTARDMDQVREAVGDSQLNYLGFSYGTELGSVYAHLFPGRIRAMVLDGAVNPLTSSITAFADQLQGFELAFNQFAAWCRVHSPCSSLGNARTAVYRIAAAAKSAPIPSSAAGEKRRATSSLVYTGILSALYSKSQWPSLGAALIQAGRRDSAGLLSLADTYLERYNGQYTNISEANTTISCNDSKPGPSDATILATNRSWTKRFPIFGAWSAPTLFACQQWQPKRTVPPLPTAKSTPTKVLVIGNLHDPATPYKGAVDLARTMGNAELLSWDGEGHTSYLEGSTCIDNYVDAYLVDKTLPPVDRTCPSV